jgi:hypothetical protein
VLSQKEVPILFLERSFFIFSDWMGVFHNLLSENQSIFFILLEWRSQPWQNTAFTQVIVPYWTAPASWLRKQRCRDQLIRKRLSFLTISVTRHIGPLERTTFHPTIPICPDEAPLFTPSRRSEGLPFLQPACITKSVCHPSHLNPQDGGSMFLQKVSICLQDYIVSTQKTSVWTITTVKPSKCM